MAYVRYQVRYSGKTGKPVGIFGACWHLWRRGLLSDEEAARFEEIENWFKEALPEPPFYADGNPDKAITYFKLEKTEEMRRRLEPLVALVRGHGVPLDVVTIDTVDEIVYEDAYQIATTARPTGITPSCASSNSSSGGQGSQRW